MSDTGVKSDAANKASIKDSQVNQEDLQKTDANATQGNPDQQANGDTAKAARLEQEVAKYAKVMKGLGIDPDSDFADQFNQGLVSHEELVAKISGDAPRREEPKAPPIRETPAQKLAKIIARVESEGASEDDFKEAVSTFRDYIEGQEQQTTMTNRQLLAQACEKTAVDFLLDDPIHKEMPNELKPIEERLFLSSTDALVGAQARKSANPERYLDPRQYQFYAEQNGKDLNQLRDYYEKRGFDKGVAAAQGRRPIVQPISPSQGGQPVVVPQGRIDIKNMSAVAKQYLSQAGQAV